jgi:hypothetical protein
MVTMLDPHPGKIGVQNRTQPDVYYKYASATAAAVMTASFQKKMLGDARFKLTISGSETIAVWGSKNGTNFELLTPILETTGNKPASSDLVAGLYRLPLKSFGHYRQFKWVGSSTSDTKTVLFVVAVPFGSLLT